MRLPKFMSCPALAREVPECMLGGVPEWFTNCGNQVAENGRKKKVIVVVKILGRNLKKKKKVLRPQYFYNIFTTNHK